VICDKSELLTRVRGPCLRGGMTGPAASRVIAVAGTSHSPMVTLDPALIWAARAVTDVTNTALYDNAGVARPYGDLAAAAGGLWH
jgi:hypothetical protein